MLFLIQKEDDYLFDFCNELILSIKHHNWLYNCNDYEYKLINYKELTESYNDCYKNAIPVGSVNFVKYFYNKYFEINVTPVDIRNFDKSILLRNIYYSMDEIDKEKTYFIKDISDFKRDVLIDKVEQDYFDKNYLITDIMDIKSEWRVFVLNNQIIDIKNYAGDIFNTPNLNVINNIIRIIDNRFSSYTIDLAVTDLGTALLEIHQFFSCGLYGCNDNKNLILMIIRTHYDIIKNKIDK